MMLTASSAIAQEKVNIGLDLTISGFHAGWLVAQKMGYFKDQGLDVTITRGYGSGDTVRRSRTAKSTSASTTPPIWSSRTPRARTFAS